MPDLEVPPDLTTESIRDRMAIPEGGDTATYSTYQQRLDERRQIQKTEALGTAAIKKGDGESLLVVSAAPGLVWPRLREFWQAQALGLNLDDSELGVMETAWRENSEELIRDKFKVFAEPGDDAGTTLLYVSHAGEQLVPQGEELVWRARPRDADVEAAMVNELKAFLSGKTEVAGTGPLVRSPRRASQSGSATGESEQQSAELISAGGGKLYIAMNREFSEAWRVTAQALDVVGVTVEQADKSRGVYHVHYAIAEMPEQEQKKKGVWSRLTFWKKDKAPGQYQLSLTGVGEKTELVVLDKDGEWDTSDPAGHLLVRLHDELNRIL